MTSQPPRNPYSEPEIDFDAASAAWNANKIRKGAMYQYRCGSLLRDSRPCTKPAISEISMNGPPCCRIHTSNLEYKKSYWKEDPIIGVIVERMTSKPTTTKPTNTNTESQPYQIITRSKRKTTSDLKTQ